MVFLEIGMARLGEVGRELSRERVANSEDKPVWANAVRELGGQNEFY
jgi:hypothetical protein